MQIVKSRTVDAAGAGNAASGTRCCRNGCAFLGSPNGDVPGVITSLRRLWRACAMAVVAFVGWAASRCSADHFTREQAPLSTEQCPGSNHCDHTLTAAAPSSPAAASVHDTDEVVDVLLAVARLAALDKVQPLLVQAALRVSPEPANQSTEGGANQNDANRSTKGLTEGIAKGANRRQGLGAGSLQCCRGCHAAGRDDMRQQHRCRHTTSAASHLGCGQLEGPQEVGDLSGGDK